MNNGYFPNIISLAAAAPATTDSADLTNEVWRGLHVVVDVTALGASATLTVTIQGKDPASGKYYTLLASAAIASTGTTVLKVYPGLTAASNLTANDILPMNWRIRAVGAVAAVTAKISAHLVH
jgi:hypothetical protein